MQPASSPSSRPWLSRIFLSSSEPRLRAGWRLLCHLVLLVVIFILLSLFLVPVAAVAPQYLNLALQVSAGVAITLATFLARRWVDHRSIISLGLRWNRQALQDLFFGFLLSGLLLGGVFLVEWAFGWLKIDDTAFTAVSLPSVLYELALIFLLFVLVGWQEELLSRGYWLQNLAEGIRMPGAVLLSSGMFALAHLANPNVSPMAFVGLTAAGLFLAYGYLGTHQLWLPIGLHIGWNFFEGPVFGFPVSGTTDFFSLLDLSRGGPQWLTGGAFGPEAGLIQYPLLLLGVWLIARYSRSRRHARSLES